MGDALSQAAVEDLAADRAMLRFPQISEARIRSEITLWCGLNKWDYPDSEKQSVALWESLRATLETAKAEALGYKTEDLAYYGLPYLREVVAQVCAGINADRIDVVYADVQRGIFKLIDPADRAVIIGVHAGWLDEGEAYEAALVALQDSLGGKRPRGL